MSMLPPDCFNGFSLAAIWSSFVQSEGTKQGAFFDPDTLEPLIDNAAMRTAMDIFVRLRAYGPPDETTAPCLPYNAHFLAGRCALTLSWGYQMKANTFLAESRVRDRTSVALLPGSTQVGSSQCHVTNLITKNLQSTRMRCFACTQVVRTHTVVSICGHMAVTLTC